VINGKIYTKRNVKAGVPTISENEYEGIIENIIVIVFLLMLV